MGGNVAFCQFGDEDVRLEARRTERDKGDIKNGGNHFPDALDKSHRTVALEFVLFTCWISASSPKSCESTHLSPRST